MGLRWLVKGGRVVYNKLKTGENWYEEKIAEPLLDEVEEAKQGTFPGEYGSRQSNWEETISASARRKVHKPVEEAGKEYSNWLSKVEKFEQKRISVAEHFIENLPGGEISGSNVLMVTDVTSVGGAHGPAEPRPEKGEFDEWLEQVWPVFERVETKDGLKREIQAFAKQSENTLDPEVFEIWENNLDQPQWASILWNNYNGEYLPRYRKTLNHLSEARENTEQWAAELDNEIETRI